MDGADGAPPGVAAPQISVNTTPTVGNVDFNDNLTPAPDGFGRVFFEQSYVGPTEPQTLIGGFTTPYVGCNDGAMADGVPGVVSPAAVAGDEFKFFTGGGAWSFVTTTNIGANQVTFAKIQQIATDKIVGRFSAGTGNAELIDCTAAGRALIDDANAAAQRTTLGLTSIAIVPDGVSADVGSPLTWTAGGWGLDPLPSVLLEPVASWSIPAGRSVVVAGDFVVDAGIDITIPATSTFCII